ncbi:hypothetical protein [Deinococcus enclensis]|uniref:Uncharacterized protein n=1 Tax=Deinococcus enclensis TaxID=1049582 RepID=A0ABT9MJA4_9DEIO|nr:hypothetical protein [Deinococcus enclensis]MDP9766541.1 hypothetical protein [Deinococcus enclensis]
MTSAPPVHPTDVQAGPACFTLSSVVQTLRDSRTTRQQERAALHPALMTAAQHLQAQLPGAGLEGTLSVTGARSGPLRVVVSLRCQAVKDEAVLGALELCIEVRPRPGGPEEAVSEVVSLNHRPPPAALRAVSGQAPQDLEQVLLQLIQAAWMDEDDLAAAAHAAH